MPLATSAFNLPDHLTPKADPTRIGGDEQHFAAIAESLEESIAELSDRLEATRRAPGRLGQEALERDVEIRRLTARLRALRRFGLDLCLGHIVRAEDPEPLYVGRLGLTDSEGRRLLIDWRSPAAEPFFGATHANPMGLASRRRYRWTRGRISDYWYEEFAPDSKTTTAHNPALEDLSAFIAILGSSRSARMRDVLGTIQADQDAIIRAGSRGALVVDGGQAPGKRSSPCTAPPTSSTLTPALVTAAAVCCSSVRAGRTWPTSPTSSQALERRVCRPALCGISFRRVPRQRSKPTRAWPS